VLEPEATVINSLTKLKEESNAHLVFPRSYSVPRVIAPSGHWMLSISCQCAFNIGFVFDVLVGNECKIIPHARISDEFSLGFCSLEACQLGEKNPLQ